MNNRFFLLLQKTSQFGKTY